MPIHTMNFDNSTFFAIPVGYFDNVDGRMWANALKNHAKKSPTPVVAVLDTSNVERMCSTLPKVFINALAYDNVLAIAIATSENMCSRHARVLNKLADVRDLRIFMSLTDAESFAQSQMNPQFGRYTLQSATYMQVSYVGAFAGA